MLTGMPPRLRSADCAALRQVTYLDRPVHSCRLKFEDRVELKQHVPNEDAILIVTAPPSVLMRRGASRMRQRKTMFAGCSGTYGATRAIPKHVAKL